MVDFKRVSERKVVAEKLIVKLEMEFNECTVGVDEAGRQIQALIDGYQIREFSELIVTLLRLTGARTWGQHKLEIIDPDHPQT